MSMYHGPASLVGFGDVDNLSTFATFHARVDPTSGVYPDWEQELISTTRHIPGSNRNDTFVSGFGIATLNLTVWFDNRAAFRLLRARYSSTATLRLLARFTSHDGEVSHQGDGRDYEDYADTTLMAISQPAHRVGGSVEAILTFQRGFDPVTGMAVI